MTGLLILIFSASLIMSEKMLITAGAAIVLHELGHIAAIYLLGGRIKKITPSPFGLKIIRDGKSVSSYKSDIVIYCAGCAVNLLTAAAAYTISGASLFVSYSLSYGIFNILPISTSDGGCALYALICQYAEDENTAGRILKITSGVFIVVLWIAGVYLILLPQCSASLFFITVYMFASIFLREK